MTPPDSSSRDRQAHRIDPTARPQSANRDLSAPNGPAATNGWDDDAVTVSRAVGRRSVRAVLFDDQDLLLLIRRTKPGRPVYWTTAGGGVEPDDPSRESALHRELLEELGARIVLGEQVFLASAPNGTPIDIQHFFLCRVISVDPALRYGPESTDPARGDYDPVRVPPDQLAAIDLRPVELRTFLTNNADALVSEAALLSRGG
jgi:8-oxo-dGTP pyrophosphatase MutT (NUDIX family)